MEPFPMRFLITLAILALSMPSWSAECSASDTTAVMKKLREYIYPSPDSPQHRRIAWTQANSDQERIITEYSGLRISLECRPPSKADELNGIRQYGDIHLEYEAARYMDFPAVTAAGVHWDEWSKWIDERESWNPSILFRNYNGKIQLQREIVGPAYSDPIPAAYVNRFFAEAEAKAAELRVKEAEQQKLDAERAEEAARQKKLLQEFEGRVTRRPDPNDYYPSNFLAGFFLGKDVADGIAAIRVCVNPAGRANVEVAKTSGVRKLDRAAVSFWSAYRFKPAPDPKSAQDICVERRVNFKRSGD